MTTETKTEHNSSPERHRFWDWTFLGANAVEWLSGMLIWAWMPVLWHGKGSLPIELPFIAGLATTFGLLLIRLKYRNPEGHNLRQVLHSERTRPAVLSSKERFRSGLVGLLILGLIYVSGVAVVLISK